MATPSVQRAAPETTTPDTAATTGPLLPHPLCTYCETLVKKLVRPEAGSEGPPIRTLGVTSSRHGEGVSTVATHLALAAARDTGRSVLLVDANIAAPVVHANFGVPLQPGLAEWLQSTEELAVHRRTTDGVQLSVLAAGKIGGRASRAHDAIELAVAMKELTADYELIVFDMPPAGQKSFALRLASLVDGVVFVVEAGRVSRDAARRTVELLRRANARLLGAVLNKQCEGV